MNNIYLVGPPQFGKGLYALQTDKHVIGQGTFENLARAYDLLRAFKESLLLILNGEDYQLHVSSTTPILSTATPDGELWEPTDKDLENWFKYIRRLHNERKRES